MQATPEQIRVFNELRDKFTQVYGSDKLLSEICYVSAQHRKDHNLDLYDTYAFVINMAEKKLATSVTVLDDVEYHEIIKVQDLMEQS